MASLLATTMMQSKAGVSIVETAEFHGLIAIV
jgi:hypothetical protein